jgi:hypothetical protein
MSRLPLYFGARRRDDDADSVPEHAADARDDRSHDDIFDLIPPRSSEPEEAAASNAEPEVKAEPPPPEPAAGGRSVHAIMPTDLRRLSIDNDGRLYWDGKPVEVRRRILMSRRQVVAASIIGLFVVVGAVGAAIQGSAAALDWACRLGLATTYCTLPEPNPPRPPDIPA